MFLFSSFSFFFSPLGSGEGRIVDRQAKAGKRCIFFSFSFFFGGAGVGYTKPTVFRVTWEVADWDMVGRRVRTYARTLQSIFNLGIVIIPVSYTHLTLPTKRIV